MRSRRYRELEDPEVFRAAMMESGEAQAEILQEPEEEESAGSFFKELIKEVLAAVIIALIVMQFIKPTIVKQRSMEPNFNSNDYLLISKQSYGLFRNKPEIGDVIVFETNMKTDNGEDKLLIKRVIGVPGDVITIKDGKVFVNGTEIDDSYTMEQYTTGDIEDLVVPENKLFCLGDNRGVSVDSRSADVGFVDYDSILGKVIFRLYPFKDLGVIKNPYND